MLRNVNVILTDVETGEILVQIHKNQMVYENMNSFPWTYWKSFMRGVLRNNRDLHLSVTIKHPVYDAQPSKSLF